MARKGSFGAVVEVGWVRIRGSLSLLRCCWLADLVRASVLRGLWVGDGRVLANGREDVLGVEGWRLMALPRRRMPSLDLACKRHCRRRRSAATIRLDKTIASDAAPKALWRDGSARVVHSRRLKMRGLGRCTAARLPIAGFQYSAAFAN